MQLKTMADLEMYFYGDLIRKADWIAGTAEPGVYESIYGKKVWLQLNTEMNLFSIIPREPWDNTGFRVLKEYLPVASGVAETGDIPEASDMSDKILEIPSTGSGLMPRIISHAFEVSEVLQTLSEKGDDVMADPLNTLKEFYAVQHVNDINTHLAAKVAEKDWNTTNDLDALDHIVSGHPEVHLVSPDSRVDLYGRDRHTESTFLDAIVDCKATSGGTARDFTLSMLDDMLKNLWKRGADPKVIVTGYDTVMALSQLLEANRRYSMPVARLVPTFNGVKGIAGTEGGFIVSTYNGIPIIPTRHLTGPTGELAPIYVLDTDYLRVRVLEPSRYFEAGIRTGDPMVIGKFAQKGLYRTILNLICRRPNVQGKIRDIV